MIYGSLIVSTLLSLSPAAARPGDDILKRCVLVPDVPFRSRYIAAFATFATLAIGSMEGKSEKKLERNERLSHLPFYVSIQPFEKQIHGGESLSSP